MSLVKSSSWSVIEAYSIIVGNCVIMWFRIWQIHSHKHTHLRKINRNLCIWNVFQFCCLLVFFWRWLLTECCNENFNISQMHYLYWSEQLLLLSIQIPVLIDKFRGPSPARSPHCLWNLFNTLLFFQRMYV